MQFVYGDFVGKENINVDVKEYAHIFKVRRTSVGGQLDWRNLRDEYLYTYQIESITKKDASLVLVSKKKDEKVSTCNLHVGWCVVDPKTIEKHIAMLNEMGVCKVTFVYADFSQKSYKIDEKRLERILISSSQQCGRSSILKVEIVDSLKVYLNSYPDSAIIDFSEDIITQKDSIKSFLVGPEGGFSEEERLLFKNKKVYGLKSNTILKSETVVVGVCAKLNL